MIVYRFHSKTKEFLGKEKARKNPKEEGYLIPAYTTQLEPPEVGKKEIAVLEEVDDVGDINIVDGLKWEVKKDYRGIYYDKNTGNEIEITEIDEDKPDNSTEKEPPGFEEDKEGIVFNEEKGEWLVKEDNRGVYWDKETKKQLEINKLGEKIPKNLTCKKPPLIEEENKEVVFNEKFNDWEVLDDYRGIYYDNLGYKYEIKEVGDLPQGDWSIIKPGEKEVRLKEIDLEIKNLKYQFENVKKIYNDLVFMEEHSELEELRSERNYLLDTIAELNLEKEELENE